MNDPVEIRYREFYDFPRLFVAAQDGVQFLFDGSFSEALDDYPDHYEVFVLPGLGETELAGSWERLADGALRYVGRVPTSVVTFDASRRKYVDGTLLRELAARQRSA